jgi:uncharacterized protein YutE (UPF0331/DUF86 family)
MTNLSVIENKISATQKYIKILERYKKYTEKEIEEDLDIRGAFERYLYLAIQSTIDLAEAVVSYKNLRKPSTMSEAFHILSEEGIISSDLKTKLSKMVGFRNIIAHDYDKINYEIAYSIFQEGLNDIHEFLRIISPGSQ